MDPHNQAAWQNAKKVTEYTVGHAPYTPPGKNQVVIRNGAVGLNAFDWILQMVSGTFAPHLTYPTILGADCAGTIVEVGPDVTRFKVGDRVTGSAVAIAKESGKAAEGAFQLYPVLRDYMICATPNHITDEQAAVLGLAFDTAAFGLFSKDYLGLDMPTVPARANPPSGKEHLRAVIITGGASSLGSSAVQLAVAAGYEVISTSSPKNFDYVRRLGAAHVFDYNSGTQVADMVRVLQDRDLCGAMIVGEGADKVCADVMHQRSNKMPNLATRKFIALGGGSTALPTSMTGATAMPMMMYNMVGMMSRNTLRKLMTGVEVKFIAMKDVVTPNGCIAQVYRDYMGPALASGQHIPSPDPLVIGRGLDKIQEGFEVMKKGVSAKKVVVSLP